ncbi:helix-turn-helix transcriptional regulator [uncultured Bifidobacterium sp.]|uniref:helix-turn-helix transcriptional regulator n=1 Tax=uncultured Bifidobacterium sp. TaxID=165187 RepID=UPI002586DDC8|nr:helix-turn-helix transcriptional regulator [uncultured Bifidobacterium sp.]
MKMNEAVGVFLKKFRKTHGYTLDQVAMHARALGANWTASTISGMERGGYKSDALPNILILLEALNNLNSASGDSSVVGLSDVFPDDESIEVTDTVSTTGVLLEKYFSKKTASPFILSSDCPQLKDTEAALFEYIFNKVKRSNSYFGEFLCHASSPVPSGAETRLAKDLGLSPQFIADLCHLKYGHSLDEESLARAGENSSPQKRGVATASIKKELAVAIRVAAEHLESQLHFQKYDNEG